MKHIFLKCMAGVLLLSLCLVLICGCGESTPSVSNSHTGGASTDTVGGTDTGGAHPKVSNVTKENLADFVIVVPDKCGSEILNTANEIKNKIKEFCGAALTVTTDRTNPVSCEILVGYTNRDAGVEFHRTVREKDSGYGFLFGKIIIAGHGADEIANSASLFYEEILQKSEDHLMSEDTRKVSEHSYSLDTLQINGKSVSEYSIVIPASSRNGEKEMATLLARHIRLNTGYVLPILKENQPTAGPVLVLGNSSVLPAEGLPNVAEGEYCIAPLERGIWISGPGLEGLNSASKLLFDSMKTSGKNASISVDKAEKGRLKSLDLTVATYNILYKSNNRNDDDMVTSVAALKSDVLGCNEVIETLYTKLNATLSAEYTCVKGKIAGDTTDFYNPIFYKTAKFDLVDSGTLWLSETPEISSRVEESNNNRFCVYAVLRDKATGMEFVYIQTHFEHTGKNENAKTARWKQAEIMKEITDKFAFLPVFIGGDFNTPSVKEIEPLLTDSRFVNTSEIAEKTEGKGTLITDFTSVSAKVYDYLFVTDDGVNIKTHTVVDTKTNGKYPSDHLPVTVEATIYQ